MKKNGKNGHLNGVSKDSKGLTNAEKSAFASSSARAHTNAISISARVQDMIEREFSPECIQAVLADCLVAQKPVVLRIGKEAEFSMEPDYATRLKAVELIWSYQLGRPIERQEIITASRPNSPEEVLAYLREQCEKSPSFRASLNGLLSGV